jgi:hypothetical protein
MTNSFDNWKKPEAYYHQISDEPIEITISKTGIARFRMNGIKPVYVDIQDGRWVNPTDKDVFDTVPFIIMSTEVVGKKLLDEWK